VLIVANTGVLKFSKRSQAHRSAIISRFIYFIAYLTTLSVEAVKRPSAGSANNELKTIWKEAAAAEFVTLFRHFPGGTEKNHENRTRDASRCQDTSISS
jgi:hypothetical protein